MYLACGLSFPPLRLFPFARLKSGKSRMNQISSKLKAASIPSLVMLILRPDNNQRRAVGARSLFRRSSPSGRLGGHPSSHQTRPSSEFPRLLSLLSSRPNDRPIFWFKKEVCREDGVESSDRFIRSAIKSPCTHHSCRYEHAICVIVAGVFGQPLRISGKSKV